MRRIKSLFTAALMFTTTAVVAADAPQIKVTDPWIRGGPASAKVMAAYLTIENNAKTADQIVGMKSEAFVKVEAHRTEIINGVARMVGVGPVEIPAGGTVKLEPNGTHLMLMGATPSVKNSKAVTVQLTFKNAGTISVELPIKKPDTTMDNQHTH